MLREVAKKLLESNWDLTPPELAHQVHSIVKRITGKDDPYKDVKKESNDSVLKMYPELKEKVTLSKDPLRTAVRLAIAGNIIDFGVAQDFDLEETIGVVLKKKFAIGDYRKLQDKLENAKTILYFVDNAGEIGFDKLLLETILETKELDKICFVVKGGPIINDATLGDAKYIGLEELPNSDFLTIDNGEAGTGPARGSQTVKKWISDYDLVVSKGQGNYEGLSEHNDLFFMLMAKCPIIAADLGVDVGDIILEYKE